jgi:hypothetical protein
MLHYAETEDADCYLHPEHLVKTVSYTEAKAWQRRLRAVGELQRVADRSLLLSAEQ